MKRRRPISALDRPSRRSARTSCSRAESVAAGSRIAAVVSPSDPSSRPSPARRTTNRASSRMSEDRSELRIATFARYAVTARSRAPRSQRPEQQFFAPSDHIRVAELHGTDRVHSVVESCGLDTTSTRDRGFCDARASSTRPIVASASARDPSASPTMDGWMSVPQAGGSVAHASVTSPNWRRTRTRSRRR